MDIKIKLKPLVFIITSIFIIMAAGCGKPGINLNNSLYEPKIAVEGFLYPGHTVSGIKIMRNFPIGSPVHSDELYLTPNFNNVSAAINGSVLSFDAQTKTYYDNQITVDYNKSYTLEIFATIDGTQLQTTATTTTPQKGFLVLNKFLGNLSYGDSIVVNFRPSPGTSFYAFSIVSDSANANNFNRNIAGSNSPDSSNIANNINQYKFQYSFIDNINSNSGLIYSNTIVKRSIWFYGPYTVIVYACDKNFKDYILTAPSVQEIDGNFHEPVETLKGNGIGVFGSAIADTVNFRIIK